MSIAYECHADQPGTVPKQAYLCPVLGALSHKEDVFFVPCHRVSQFANSALGISAPVQIHLSPGVSGVVGRSHFLRRVSVAA